MSQPNPYDLSANVAIRACAGAGKTHTLTWRYLVILDEFARQAIYNTQEKWQGPANILAITFTNKATAELNSRIRETLGEVFNNKKQDHEINLVNLRSSESEYREWLSRELLHSQIMTLDAFCLMVLQENPIESGVDLGVSVPDESDYKKLLSSRFIKLFNSLPETVQTDLVRSFSYHGIEPIFRTALVNQVHFDHIIERYTQPDETIYQNWVNDYQPKFELDVVVNELQSISEIVTLSLLPEDIIFVWQKWVDRCQNYQQEVEENRPSVFKIKLFPHLMTKTGDVRKSFGKTGGNAAWEKAGMDIDPFNERIITFRKTLINLPISDVEFIFTPADQDHIKLIKKMLRLFSRYFVAVDEEKRRQRIITYEDMLRKTLELFKSSPQIPEFLTNRYPHILVDEFQDTNSSHWQIIKAICGKDDPVKSSGLFIVGDEKQSIYRFNRADVTVFAEAEKDLYTTKSFEGVSGLNWNFRSTQELINCCINPLFEQILAPEKDKPKYSFIAKHQETCLRDGHQKSAPAVKHHAALHPFEIDLLPYSKEEKDIFKQDMLSYPLHIAEKVKVILESEDVNQLDIKDKYVVCVLLNAVKPVLDHYIEAFRIKGIDVEIPGGQSFYQSQEIMDVEMVLSIILNPHDDVALCGLLRSPLFAYTDDEIHQFLKTDRIGKSIYDWLDYFDHSFKIEIDEWKLEASSTPIDRVLEFIFNKSYRDLGYLSEPNGQVRRKNIEKMIRIIHGWSLSGMTTEEIRWKLRDEIEHNSSEGSEILTTGAKVVIMSIHKAKGLAFPYVIIPEIQKRFFSDNRNRINLDFAVTHKGDRLMEPGFAPRNDQWETTNYVLNSRIKYQQKLELFEEKKRLLYVAITRAEYGVILSGTMEKEKLAQSIEAEIDDCKSWLDWLRKIYSINDPMFAESDKIVLDNGPTICKNEWTTSQVEEKTELEEFGLYPKEAYYRFKKYSQLGVTALFKPKKNGHENGEKSTREKGILAHKILEMAWLNTENPKIPIWQWLEKQPQSFSEKLGEIDLDEMIKSLGENQYISIIQSADEVYKELSVHGLIYSMDNNWVFQISGIIDVLYRTDEKWIVADYKTGFSKGDISHYIQQVQMYLHLVWQAFGIKADGQLIFLDENQEMSVNYEEKFLENLDIKNNTGFIHYPLKTLPAYTRFEHVKLQNSALIVVPSQRNAREVWNMLAAEGMLHPSHRIITAAGILNVLSPESKTPSELVMRLAVSKVLKKSPFAKSVGKMEGVLAGIASAFYMHAIFGGKLAFGLSKMYKNWTALLTGRGYNMDIYDQISHAENSVTIPILVVDEGAIVNPWVEIALNILVERSASITWIDLNGSLMADKQPLGKLPEIERKKITVFMLPDFRNEVRFIGKKILAEQTKGTEFSEIAIVLPSMEKYMPIMAGEFRRNGIPLQIRKSEPLSERQIIKTLLALAQIMVLNHVQWRTLKTWLDFPIAVEISPVLKGMDFDNLYKIDLLIRKQGLDLWQDINTGFQTGKKGHQPFLNDIQIINDWVISVKQSATGDLNKDLLQLLEKYQPAEIITADEQRAFKGFKTVLNELNEQLSQWQVKFSPHEAIRELENLISQSEFSSTSSDWGVEVLSVTDSMYLERKIIFIPGMTQKGFPVSPVSNPFISNVPDCHFSANMKIFSTWAMHADQVIATCPEKDNRGNPTLPSICLEKIEIETLLGSVDFEPLKKMKLAIGKMIQTDCSDHSFLKQVQRHNAFVKKDSPLEYFGGLNGPSPELAQKVTSATALDELHFKPLYFLLNRCWGIREVDRKPSDFLDKGTFIHEVLEQFGNGGGWDLNRKDPENAKIQLIKTVTILLEKWTGKGPASINIFHELNLSEPTIWQRIIDEDREFYPGFIHMKSEQAFGQDKDGSLPYLKLSHPDLGSLMLKGQIDRIDQSGNGDIIIAQDYKSGVINWDGEGLEMSCQLFIYALILKQEFPQAKIGIGYRRVKSIKYGEWGFHPAFILDGDVESYTGTKIKQGKNHILFKDFNDINKIITSSFIPLLTGEFKPFSFQNHSTDEYYYLKAVSRLETVRYFL